MDEYEAIKRIEEEFEHDIKNASHESELERLKVKYLGRKEGLVTGLLKAIPQIDPAKRKDYGRAVNQLKEKVTNGITRRLRELQEEKVQRKLLEEKVNVHLPGRPFPVGAVHPISRVMDEIIDIFLSMGFEVEEGPEIEDDYHNFEGLNIPKDHPARDMQDTFYIEGGRFLLRTHTSPVQIRVMEVKTPPLKVIAPGRVYRRDFDVSHSPMFHQVEGFAVDVDISFAHLKGVISEFLRTFFLLDIPVRFRPSYFPFTEPSAEVDIGCVFCGGEGCRICGEGWIEVMGCGMIHPEVLKNVHLDPEKFSGFAFGVGVERLTMLKYSISDIRLFYEGNLDFLEQFR